MDDEGTPTGRTVLIESGILRGYITDKLNARLMGIPVTGNGRRESYQSVVLPRMTNTFMLAGDRTRRTSSAPSIVGCMPCRSAAGRWISPTASLCFPPAKPI